MSVAVVRVAAGSAARAMSASSRRPGSLQRPMSDDDLARKVPWFEPI
jgi:hypothetical protein